MAQAVRTGIYNPKSPELTRYRKTKLNKISKEFGQFFNINKFTFVAAPKADKKLVISRATALEFKPTKEGFFIPNLNYGKVTLKKNKKNKEYYIERSGKTKWGKNTGRKYKSVTPLASVDELGKEIDRIKEMAKKFGPLSGNERLAFEITEQDNQGFSKSTFETIERLLAELETYQKSVAARINFLRHISVVKTESFKVWYKDHPPKPPKSFSRRIFTKANVKGRN